ncbi:MAG: extracellular solute-binding protein, partial [Patescibacteria group bacterium]
MPTRSIKFAVLILLAVVVVTAGFGCKGVTKDELAAMQPVTLTYWRVWDQPDNFREIINAYRAQHPNVTVEVRAWRYEEYEQQLLDALAEDRGPDLFSVPNTWMMKYRSKLLPAPASVVVAREQVVDRLGGLQKEKVITLETHKLATPRQVKESFVDVVSDDVVLTDPETGTAAVFGLPLSVDTLALFYNRDVLNGVGIPEPPQTWTEFQSQVKKIVRQDKQGNIIQAGAALGTANNVPRNFDLLSLLMMQNGTVMAQGNRVLFHQIPATLPDRAVPPADEAVIFYTDFAYPAKEVYTWNDQMPNGLDAFINGQVGFFFGYSYDLQTIRQRAPKLNFSYAAIPQIEGNPEVTYANYWVEGVSKKTTNANWAWVHPSSSAIGFN